MYRHYIKYILDFFIATFAFILLSPIFIFVTIALFISNSGKPFFFQERPGKNEKIFKVIKFKTMTDAKDSKGVLLPNHKRITKIGSFIRKTSLDEIPQLINVIKGDMSLIGPRPLLKEYLPLYNTVQKTRHNIRPGISGWAQVNGRNNISWKKKFEYDIFYVNNLSFLLDIKIIFMTILKVIKKEGVNTSEKITMERFNGNN